MTTEQYVKPTEIVDVAGAKSQLGVWWKCRDEHGGEPIRLLDQAEVLGTEWGKCLTLQIMSYGGYEWLSFNPPTRATRSLQSWYAFIRTELQWTGRVVVAVAAA